MTALWMKYVSSLQVFFLVWSGQMYLLVYVNDISESLLSLTRLFADDSSLFYSASNIN